MKKILAILLLTVSLPTFAHGPHGYYRHGGDNRWFWMAPVIAGGVIAYEVSRPPVYVQSAPPVVIQQTPAVVQGQNCSPWTQIQNPDGTITTTRTCQ
jgi:hypothetical protein